MGDLRNDVVETLDMLDVDRGINIDAAREQLFDIKKRLGWRLPGALVWASSSTRASCGCARDQRVDIHLLQHLVAIADPLARDDFEAL